MACKGDDSAQRCLRVWGDPTCCWELVTGCVVKCGACLSVIIDERGLAGAGAGLQVGRGVQGLDRLDGCTGVAVSRVRRGAAGRQRFTVSRSEALMMKLSMSVWSFQAWQDLSGVLSNNRDDRFIVEERAVGVNLYIKSVKRCWRD